MSNVVFDTGYKQFIKTFGGCYVGIDTYVQYSFV